MAIVCLRCAFIAVGQCAPPMRHTAGDWWRNVMKRISDIMRQFAVGNIYGDMTGKARFLGKLESGNRVVGCAAMRSEQCQILWRYADFIPHREQSTPELLDCRYRGWVAKFVHKSENILNQETVRGRMPSIW